MTQKQQSLLNFSAILIFSLLLLGFGVLAWLGNGIDFRGYFGAASLIRQGGNPYDYQQLAPVLEQLTGFQGNNPYFYPPWFALSFVPLTFLPYQAARAVWLLINVVLLWGALVLMVQSLPWRFSLWQTYLIYTVVMIMVGVYCLLSEQAGIVLLFGLALFVWGVRHERPFWVAFGLLLLVTKPQATFLLVICLGFWILFYQRQAAVWGLICLGVTTAVSTLAIPRWWSFDRTGFGAGLSVELAGADQTVVATRVNTTLSDFLAYQLRLPDSLLLPITVVVALLTLLFIGYIWYRSHNLTLLICSSLLGTLLITPYALQYDYPPLAFVVLFVLASLPNLQSGKKAATLLLLGGGLLIPVVQTWSYQGFWLLLAILAAYLLVVWPVQNDEATLRPAKGLKS